MHAWCSRTRGQSVFEGADDGAHVVIHCHYLSLGYQLPHKGVDITMMHNR